MKTSNQIITIFSLIAILFFSGCAGDPSGTPTTVAKSGNSENAVADHRPPRDTIDWQTANIDGRPPWSGEADREWPGEEMGLIGPIMAMGGSGSKTYVAVYDTGGIFIGALYLKEVRQDPSRLENLILLANQRSAIQNSRTIQQVSVRRFLALAQAARQKEAP